MCCWNGCFRPCWRKQICSFRYECVTTMIWYTPVCNSNHSHLYVHGNLLSWQSNQLHIICDRPRRPFSMEHYEWNIHFDQYETYAIANNSFIAIVCQQMMWTLWHGFYMKERNFPLKASRWSNHIKCITCHQYGIRVAQAVCYQQFYVLLEIIENFLC